jgi:hypothetical protein
MPISDGGHIDRQDVIGAPDLYVVIRIVKQREIAILNTG